MEGSNNDDRKGFKIPKVWTWRDKDLAYGFDNHVRHELPWYDLVTKAAGHVCRNFLTDSAIVYEIGASTGNFSRSLGSSVIGQRRIRWIGIEGSALMADKYDGIGELIVEDCRSIEYEPFDLGVSFLCLMFIPRVDRPRFISRWFGKLKPGGAIVIVEKFAPVGGFAGTIIHRLSIAAKVDAGVYSGSIVDKELSLMGSQIPLDPEELSLPGSRRTSFFKFGDFEGWLIEKAP